MGPAPAAPAAQSERAAFASASRRPPSAQARNRMRKGSNTRLAQVATTSARRREKRRRSWRRRRRVYRRRNRRSRPSSAASVRRRRGPWRTRVVATVCHHRRAGRWRSILRSTRSSRLTSFVPPCCTLLSDIAELSAAEEKASSGVQALLIDDGEQTVQPLHVGKAE
jgi:hypothetical protein